jgi:hypothetical protein
LGDERWHDLIVILDDATSEIYYAQLVQEESTQTVMAGLREVIEQQGLFCALYSDRGSHFWLTPKAGEKVDHQRVTQVGRALRELGVRMIPAYSPQARGRSERNFGTWQGRLPQELRLRWITTVDATNSFLQQEYIAALNATLAGCTVTLHQHLDGTLSLRYGPYCVRRYNAEGRPWNRDDQQKAVDKPLGNPAQSTGFPLPHSLDGGW